MEEIEVPLEQIQEHIHHEALHAHDKMMSLAAVASAVLAVCAAIAALMAGHTANEAMIEQLQASDSWSHYQAKSIKSAVLETRVEILKSLKAEVSESALKKIDSYRDEQKEIQEKAQEKEKEATHHLSVHQTLAKAVTFFQIAIAVMAISVLVRKKPFMYLAIGFGSCGLVFLILGLMS